MPSWLRDWFDEWSSPSQEEGPPPDFILRVTEEAAKTFSRPPYEIHSYEMADEVGDLVYVLVWEDHVDGFGLLAIIGQEGERLLSFFQIEHITASVGRLGFEQIMQTVDLDETITITYEELMSQKKITATITKKGEVTLQTEGYEGNSCKEATAALERELGEVEKDTNTPEMYKTQEQTISQSVGE